MYAFELFQKVLRVIITRDDIVFFSRQACMILTAEPLFPEDESNQKLFERAKEVVIKLAGTNSNFREAIIPNLDDIINVRESRREERHLDK